MIARSGFRLSKLKKTVKQYKETEVICTGSILPPELTKSKLKFCFYKNNNNNNKSSYFCEQNTLHIL